MRTVHQQKAAERRASQTDTDEQKRQWVSYVWVRGASQTVGKLCLAERRASQTVGNYVWPREELVRQWVSYVWPREELVRQWVSYVWPRGASQTVGKLCLAERS